jgi:hypothetical protein
MATTEEAALAALVGVTPELWDALRAEDLIRPVPADPGVFRLAELGHAVTGSCSFATGVRRLARRPELRAQIAAIRTEFLRSRGTMTPKLRRLLSP